MAELSAGRAPASTQRGLMKGHVIMYPQNPSRLATVLPPSLEEVGSTPICVLFIGSSPPTQEWLDKARPLYVRREKVRAAFNIINLAQSAQYLLFTNMSILNLDHVLLDSFPEAQSLPVHVEHVLPNPGADVLTSRYDLSPSATEDSEARAGAETGSDEAADRGDLDAIPFQNIVITDVDGHAPSNQLRAAAFRHVKHQGGGYFQIPHGSTPMNKFDNPDLFPMMYPCLFPYGIGGFDDLKLLCEYTDI